MMSAISQPLPCSVCLTWLVRATGSLTTLLSAAAWSSVYVGLWAAAVARPLLSCSAPSLASPALLARVALPEASERPASAVVLVPSAS